MATLTIRNLPDDVRDALRRQAAEHRRSMEAEARAVLQAAVAPKPTEGARAEALARLRTMKPSIDRGEPEGWSGVDEFLAEKHLEAAWDAGSVSDEERRMWLDRLERFEVWPKDIETFLTERRVAGR
jgi:plasmid stability protein